MLKYVHHSILVDMDHVKKIDRVEGRTVVIFDDDTTVLLDPFYGQKLVKIEDLGLSNRAINTLHNEGIYYVHQIPKNINELIRIPLMGKKTAEEIFEKCQKTPKNEEKC